MEIKRGRAIAKSFCEAVVRKLEAVGIAARRAKDSTPVPLHALVVKGQLITIQEGSRVQRIAEVEGERAGAGENALFSGFGSNRSA